MYKLRPYINHEGSKFLSPVEREKLDMGGTYHLLSYNQSMDEHLEQKFLSE
jgi:hypothetical protein